MFFMPWAGSQLTRPDASAAYLLMLRPSVPRLNAFTLPPAGNSLSV